MIELCKLRTGLMTAIVGIVFLCACQSKLERALKLSGSNRTELEKVLEHFADSAQKYEAARFLIENMEGHYWQDTTGLHRAGKLLSLCGHMRDSMELTNNYNDKQIADLVNPMWEKVRKTLPPTKYLNDLQTISADFLIKHINNAFFAWHSNPYTKKFDFALFLTNILPYRLSSDGKSIESGASLFWQKLKPDQNLKDAVDSALLKFHGGLRYTEKILTSFLYLRIEDLMLSKYGDCFDHRWLNTKILSGTGFAVASDFVPMWGNRNSSHTWNVVLRQDGSPIALDPFLAPDRWELSNMYDNISTDNVGWWGTFRLPKVYRYTYQRQTNEIIDSGQVEIENIPDIFKTHTIQDVSACYFKTSTIVVDLPTGSSISDDFAYLCVAQLQKWVPVAYARIVSGKAVFSDIGRDIVYLPTCYRNGKVIPIAEPIYLDSSGTQNSITLNTIKKNTMNLVRKYYTCPRLSQGNYALQGRVIYGANKPDFSDSISLAKLDHTIEQIPYLCDVSSTSKFRYIRFNFTTQSLLSEFRIIGPNGSPIIPKSVYIDKQQEKYANSLPKLFDSIFTSTVAIVHRTEVTLPYMSTYLQYDLGKPHSIKEVLICGSSDGNNVEPGLNYELYYWDGSWVSCGVKQAHSGVLSYEQIPSDGLYYLKCLDKGNQERIFLYENGKQNFK